MARVCPRLSWRVHGGAVVALGLATALPGTASAGGATTPPPAAAVARPSHGAVDFGRQVMPLFEKYCTSCHGEAKKKGDLSLEGYRGKAEPELLKEIVVWQTVAERMEAREMPPEEKPQPTGAELELILAWIEAAELRVAAEGKRDPGRVTIRRLNRAEYNNSARDLFGVDLKPAQDFPSDDVGYGFDNIGDVLSMPPILVERYLTAAERVAEKVIVAEVEPRFRRHTIEVERLAPTPAGSVIRGGALTLAMSGAVRAEYEFPVDGDYAFRVKAAGRAAGREPARLALKVDGHEVKALDVRGAAVYTIRASVEAGPRRLEIAFANGVPPADGEPPPVGGRRLTLDFVRIEGPLAAKARALPESHLRIIPRRPTAESWRADARAFLSTLATRAYRRPVTPEEIERLARFVEEAVADGDTFERGMQLAVRAMLVSPHFLYRVELDAGAKAGEARPIGAYEIASRLSYFLWSSMPDEELFRLAADGSLAEPEVVEAQARRMLQDPKARALVENFASQWLQVRNLASVRPARRLFPQFDDNLRAAMMKETELFFAAVVREDLDLLTLLDADFTYLNERLARHYGIEGVEGNEFRRVSLAGTPRGGVLTQASVLTVTSNPTRTSPVKRGRWVLEQLLGTPPPPPPPGVPELPNEEERRRSAKNATLRELLEEHRKDPNCAVCHKKMDPLGLGLENFDPIGAWRTHEKGQPIDASGVLPNGQSFDGPAALKAVLRSKAPAFRRSLASKLLTYALGRGTEASDRVMIDEISEQTARGDNKFSSLVLAIVKSDPFLKRRGEATP